MVGWVGSVALRECLAEAPCGCDLAERAESERDPRARKALTADVALHRERWRCPRAEGGAVDPSALGEAHRAALERTRALTGADEGEFRTCPGHYARMPEAFAAVELLRWFDKGQMHLRCPHPTPAVVEAIDLARGSVAARERDEIERLKANPDREP